MLESIYVFLIRNDVWIYILCGLGLLWYLGEFVRSRSLLNRAMFGLEKERGRRMLTRSLALIILLGLIIIAVTYVNLSIAPTLPSDLLKPPTPTPNIFVTPLSSPTPAGGPATPTLVLAPTVTLPAPATASSDGSPIAPEDSSPGASPGPEDAVATATAEEPSGVCAPDVRISAPPEGATISGSVTFFGTATGEDFSSLEFEAIGPNTNGVWSSLPVSNNEPIIDNIIGAVNVSTWIPGPYQFRISVFDSTGALTGQCQILLAVAAPN